MARDDIGGSENGLNFFFGNAFDFAGLSLGVGEPHAKLNFPAEGPKGGGGEDTFGGTSDTDVEIDARIGEGGGYRGGDIAIGNGAQGGARTADGIDERLVAGAVENEDHEIANAFM